MTTRPLIVSGTVLVCLFCVLYARTDQSGSANGQSISVKQDAADSTVRMKTFYLKDGGVVMGRVISEDRNQITLEQFNKSPVVVRSYGKRQIASGTTQTRIISQLEYYKNGAALFADRAWDFRDDPDDFIQSIRLYEKVKQILSQRANPVAEEISEIDDKIAQVRAERETWITEAESRAKLSKLQTRAVIDQRMDELRQEISKNAVEMAAIREAIDENHKALHERISDSERVLKEFYRILQGAIDDIENNEEDIDDLERRYRRYSRPRVYITPPH